MSELVFGLGFRAAATPASFQAAIAEAVTELGAEPQIIAVPADKAGHPGLAQIAARIVEIDPESLDNAATNTVTNSPVVQRLRGLGSVCEAAALAAAGPGAQLVLTRRISPDRLVTIAAARGGAHP